MDIRKLSMAILGVNATRECLFWTSLVEPFSWNRQTVVVEAVVVVVVQVVSGLEVLKVLEEGGEPPGWEPARAHMARATRGSRHRGGIRAGGRGTLHACSKAG